MRILVAIANHGTKNRHFLDELLAAYNAMPWTVDVVVLSDAPKDLGPDVEVAVGAPTDDPWSLPFAHRPIFGERAGDYDLFVYSEDDTLVEQAHVEAFCAASEALPDGFVPGFMRYELRPSGERSYCSVHSHYRWDPASVRDHGGLRFAEFDNAHAAMYMLTASQLRSAIDSGGFLVAPHAERFDMLVSAATDPYTQCGLQRVLCLSRIDDFMLHHLPNVYLDKLGIAPRDFELQIGALDAIGDERASEASLFEPVTTMATAFWDRSHYPKRHPAVPESLAHEPGSVLSFGVTTGDLEQQLFPSAESITAIPLDSVFRAVADARGLVTTEPVLESALDELGERRFDVVFVRDAVGHLRDPSAVLRLLGRLLAPEGAMLVTAPNMHRERLKRVLRRGGEALPRTDRFDEFGMHQTTASVVSSWVRGAGLEPYDVLWAFDRPQRALVDRLAPLVGQELTVVASAAAAD